MTRLAPLALVAALVAACAATSERPIEGPHGTSHLIRCATSEGCFEEAHRTCPEGYDLDSRSAGELVVTCRWGDARREERAAGSPDDAVCALSYANSGQLPDYWAAHANAKRRSRRGVRRGAPAARSDPAPARRRPLPRGPRRRGAPGEGRRAGQVALIAQCPPLYGSHR